MKATNGSEGLIFCSSAHHGFVVLRFPRHGPETGAGRVEVGDFLVPWIYGISQVDPLVMNNNGGAAGEF